jgi:predicted porin
MKLKTSALALFALTAAAGAAQAQSSVKLYGLVNEDFGSYQLAGSAKTKGLQSGNMATSFWGISGTEDLGTGTKAIFALEGFFLADTGSQGRFSGDTMFARSAYVGLSGDWGLVKMGRNTNLTFLSLLLFNSFGDSFGFSPTILHYFTDQRGFGAKLEGDSGWSNSITYMSPSFAGFKVNLQGAFAEGAANGKSNFGGNVIYSGGPFGATLSYQTVGSTPTPAGGVTAGSFNTQKENTWTTGLSYDFGMVKLYGQYGKIKDKIYNTENKIWDISAAVPVTASGKVLFAYGQSKVTGLNGTVFADTKRKTASLAYDHNLSKRTDVYIVYMNDKIPSFTTATIGSPGNTSGKATGNTVALGMKHAF